MGGYIGSKKIRFWKVVEGVKIEIIENYQNLIDKIKIDTVCVYGTMC